ncbi:threonine dehydratase 1 biosynthetic, chloroplastic-like [Triticum dicoccoides]|uniref:threonine dehydratase 1 biosynthetic, chloroplastic-like n=1 Tax=Triticum dicoccoides TaxID=85692 RepID=UPI00188F672A|nr:threonine dehydratase 1 biosynthetic, chloroplastic-like [Triticum dicoccoides]
MEAAAAASPSMTSFRPASRSGRVACWARSSPGTATPLRAVPLMRVAPESLQAASGSLVGVPSRGAGEQDWVADLDGPGAMEYLTSVLASKVYDVALETPLERARNLSDRLGVNLHIKREDLQPAFSFKLRGAYNMMAKLSQEQLNKGVICSSAGNHAQGVALSAQRLGCHAVIVMPVTTPENKWQSVEKLGATVVLNGDSYDEAQSYAKLLCEEEGLTFIPPFDHPDIIAGQGTVGMEIVRQLQGPLHAIFVPVGGGGLIAGIAAYVKRVCPEVKIIGVEPSDANAMALSLFHGQRVMLEHIGGFADGVAVKVVGKETFPLCQDFVDGIVLVSQDAICASIKDMFEENRNILEPSGALALAGAEAYCKYYGLKGETVVAISSGANMNFDALRLVTELPDVGRKPEAVLPTFLPKEQRSFKKFAELFCRMNINGFKHICDSHGKEALVLHSGSDDIGDEPVQAKPVEVGDDGKECEDSCRPYGEGEKPLAWLDARVVTTTLIVNLMTAGLGLYVKAQHPSAHPLVVTCWEALPLTMVRVVLVSGLGAALALGVLLMYAGIKMSLQGGSRSRSA